MRDVQLADAKARLSELVSEVEKGGQSVRITRHGKPVVRLVSEEDARRADVLKAIAEIRAARKTAPRVTVEEILAWRDEGRE
jgi:prevent-host-death family protein